MTKYGIEIKHLPTGTEIESDIEEYTTIDAISACLTDAASGKLTHIQVYKNGDKIWIPREVLMQSVITLFKETV